MFVFLMFGVVFNSFFRPFLGILLQANKPGFQTIMTFALFTFYLIGSIFLIPLYGILGAAIATSFFYVFEAILIKYFSKILLKIHL